MGRINPSSNDRLKRALVAKCHITFRPTIISKVSCLACIDETIYGHSLPSVNLRRAVVSYCRKYMYVHLDRTSKLTDRGMVIKLIVLCMEMFRYLVIHSSVHFGPFLVLGDLINFKGDHPTKSRIAKEIRMKGQRSEVTI